jgi:conjugative transposon TraM protein
MNIQEIKQRINFRQPKYMLPAILYLPILATGYFVIGIFTTEKAEVPDNSKQTTEYLNPNLPGANIKGDGIGGKYDNMKNSYGMIEDATAVNNIDRSEEEQKEDYESKYSDEERARLEAEALGQTNMVQPTGGETARLSKREEEALAELNKAIAEARLKGQKSISAVKDQDQVQDETGENHQQSVEVRGKIDINDVVKSKPTDAEKPTEVVKKIKTSSDYFNTLTANEKEPHMIKAIIDENIKAVDGSRVRLRLLDDIEVGETVVRKGSYLYAIMSGFGSQRVKGSVKSVMVSDEIVKINLSLYDADGLEGLYVPGSSFRETAKDVASGAMSGNMDMSSTNSGNSLQQWGMQAAQNAYQKTSNAISKAIRKNRVSLKYGTFVYLINSKESKNK